MNKLASFLSEKRNKTVVYILGGLILDLALSISIMVVQQREYYHENGIYMNWGLFLFWMIIIPGTLFLILFIVLLIIAVIKFIVNKIR